MFTTLTELVEIPDKSASAHCEKLR